MKANLLVPITSAADSTPSYFASQFPGAAALYSLHKLSKQATSVVRVRRSLDDTEMDFSASDISGSKLLDFVNTPEIQDLFNSTMYFDGVDDYISDTKLPLAGETYLKIEAVVYYTGIRGSIITQRSAANNQDFFFDVNNDELRFAVGNQHDLGIVFASETLSVGLHTVACIYDSTQAVESERINLFIDGVKIAKSGGSSYPTLNAPMVANYNTLRIGAIDAVDHPWRGVISDVKITVGETLIRTYTGDSTAASSWLDGTVHGSPAVFTGQGLNGYVSTWYDQRVPTSKQRMHFDGVDDYVDTGFKPDTNDRTIFYRAIFSDVDDDWQISGANDGNNRRTYIGIGGASQSYKIRVGANDNFDSEIGSGVPLDEEVSLALSLNNGTGSVYMNGVLVDTITYSTKDEASDDNFFIGSNNAGTPSYTKGTVFDMRFFDEALSGNDISNLHNDADSVTSGLVHKWNGYGNTSEDWTDQSGSNNGTVYGSPARISTADYTVISNDAVQTTTANQSLIVEDGTLVVENTEPMKDYDGVNTYERIDKNTFTTPTTELQVSVVCRNNNSSLSGDKVLISQYDSNLSQRSWAFDINKDEKIDLTLGDPANGSLQSRTQSDDAVAIDELQVIGFTFNAGTIKLYRNGVELASSTYSGTSPVSLFDATVDVTIGCLLSNDTPAASLWNGQIGEIYASTNLDDDIVAVQQNQMSKYNVS